MIVLTVKMCRIDGWVFRRGERINCLLAWMLNTIMRIFRLMTLSSLVGWKGVILFHSLVLWRRLFVLYWSIRFLFLSLYLAITHVLLRINHVAIFLLLLKQLVLYLLLITSHLRNSEWLLLQLFIFRWFGVLSFLVRIIHFIVHFLSQLACYWFLFLRLLCL